VIFLLSVKAGLRAKEIASLSWDMVTDAEGNLGSAIRLQNSASKGTRGGRVIPLHPDLKNALATLLASSWGKSRVVTSERCDAMSSSVIVNLFAGWYQSIGLQGCSSHSGRRTFITNAARQISTVGGSLRDVQMLAGHAALTTTQRYIDENAEAQLRVVELI
jgi:integrase/recombinase XerD